MPMSVKLSAPALYRVKNKASTMHTAVAKREASRIAQFLLVIVSCCFAVFQPLLQAQYQGQFTPEPQAQTPEEYDRYLDFLALTSPAAIVAAGDAFENAFPKSELLRNVYRTELDAWKELGNSRKAVLAGEKALQLAPDNLDILVELAYLISDTETNPTDLAKARIYGNRVLGLLQTIQIPRTITPQEWKVIRKSLESRAYSALGLAAFKDWSLEEAIRNFELGVSSSPSNDAALLYRLGVTYRLAGRKEKSRAAFERAEKVGVPEISKRAQQELVKLQP